MSKGKPTYNEIIFTDEQEQQIIDMYLNQNISTVKIGNYFHTTHKPIAKVLERYNISRTGVGLRKYKLNEKYFDNINTPNKAYILGFLFADGCNCMSKQTIHISLQESDKQILEDMRKEIGSEKELEYIDNSNVIRNGYISKNMWRMNLFSKHMCQSLNSLGMIPNKSLKVEFPIIPKELYNHFIRGVFDGDGCIHNSTKHRYVYNCSIVGTYNLCCKIQDILKEKNIDSYIREASNHNGITSVLKVCKRKSVIKFLDYMYQDAEMYLQRKYDRYLHCKQIYQEQLAS